MQKVCLQIARGDSIAASKVWSSWGGFCQSEQAVAAKEIIEVSH
jgi:hypothetical protein